MTIVPTQPGEEGSELSPQGDGEPRKESGQKSDVLRSESDRDRSDCCVLGGNDWQVGGSGCLEWARIKVVWTILGARTGGRQEEMNPRAAGRVAAGTGCREWRVWGWERFRVMGQSTESGTHTGGNWTRWQPLPHHLQHTLGPQQPLPHKAGLSDPPQDRVLLPQHIPRTVRVW